MLLCYISINVARNNAGLEQSSNIVLESRPIAIKTIL